METDATLLACGSAEVDCGTICFSNVPAHPLELAYVVVLVCQGGEAELEVNFQPYSVKPHDLLVLAEDSIVVMKQRSRQFRCSYYVLQRSLAAEVAYALPNHLFSYLNTSPYIAASEELTAFVSVWERHLQRVGSIGRSPFMPRRCTLHRITYRS